MRTVLIASVMTAAAMMTLPPKQSCPLSTACITARRQRLGTLRAFTAALDALCEAFMAKDSHGVGEAASDARDALHDLISDE